MLVLFAVAAMVELGLFWRPLWKYRLIVGSLALSMTAFAIGIMMIDYIGVMAWLVLFVSIYRGLNFLRIAKGRMHEKYLRTVARRSSYVFILISAVLMVGLLIEDQNPHLFTTRRVYGGLLVLQVVTGLIILFTTFRTIRKMLPRAGESIPENKLPTVTVAIPARNETEVLGSLLDSVLASTYPKLEVLVLDDCSQDKTSEVIKSYAQTGVRFLHGQEPKEQWIAKNQAYQQLFEAASGQIILFCGADTTLGPETISRLVGHMENNNKSMISVLPKHWSQDGWGRLVQPLRYWWQVAVPRRLFNRPAALSTFWMVRRKTLKDLGGFASVSRSVVPESYLARQIAKQADGYSFLRTTDDVIVKSNKPLADQLDRALRVRYPEVHRRLELVMSITAAEAFLLVVPFFLVPVGIINGWVWVALPALLVVVLLSAANMAILSISGRLRKLEALFNFPIICMVEIVLGTISMLLYEFTVVEWKGRNVCLPVMHHTPSPYIDYRHNHRKKRHHHHRRR